MSTRRALLALAVAAGALLAPASPAHALTCGATYPTQAQRYVCGLYEDVLLRSPSANEVGYWADRVNRFPRRQTVEAFEYSVEVMVELAGQGYHDILDRESDPAGLGYWTDRLRSGALTPQGYLRQLSDSEEFDNLHPTSGDVVDFWYGEIFHRVPDAGGREFWIGRLDTGLPRSALVASLQDSDEAVAHDITLVYQPVLQRAPDGGAIPGWSSFYRQQGSARLVVELASSQEAFDTAG
jgi:hypothetical protein